MGLPTGSLPVTEKAAQEIVSIPIYAELTDDMINTVIEGILAYSSLVAV
jgi:dTDP-4-amino-4,6-dideoxygalactose transaminase